MSHSRVHIIRTYRLGSGPESGSYTVSRASTIAALESVFPDELSPEQHPGPQTNLPAMIENMIAKNKEPKIAVLLPCYNEEVTIGKVVRDFRTELPKATVYVYDNNSTDRTAEIAEQEGAIVRKEPRQGKGNVIRAMFEDIDADAYIIADGDDTYPADAAPAMVEKILEGYDMVIGTASAPHTSRRTSVRSTTSATD